ncbi:molybdopterin cofactor-binding domain-containing protein [Hyphomicrobium sp.]|uniref:xanthine dehydrogenase family protein molybdopterin-binding subunit n=1 Tax=Hyphomicrobium sp. TaxID=82 RepID=UPI000F9C3C43|nr:molybdopterin cofactor-binding domain-containing protein [Hyphomicrobium sp.]RUP00451.1 MAG: xanthine dehydrogenase family protein molybdopterin-binding subunit [Hyphomicrobium sp.]
MLQYLKAEADRGRTPVIDAEISNVSRRGLLTGILGVGAFVLSVRLSLVDAKEAHKPYPTGGLKMPDGVVADPHVFIAIAPNGDVSIVTHRSEMGTGIRTSLPMVVADEMCADWSRVHLVQAPGDEPRYGNQDTDGSRSMRHFIQPMRQCGAAMRQMLETAAAAKWNVDPAMCQARNHEVVLLDNEKKETGKVLPFGELAQAAMALPVPAVETILYKSPDEFTLMGKGEVQIADLHNITVGKAGYGADVRLPGMKFAVMARPAVLGGRIKSYDASAALKVPGVHSVQEIAGVFAVPRKFAQLGGIAVVADSTYAAMQGRDALTIEWEDGPNVSYNSDSFTKEMSETAAKPGKVLRNQGDPDAAFAASKDIVTAEYHSQHLVQAPMEPLVAIARIADGKAEIWSCVQSPYGARKDIAEALKMPIENVTVHVSLLGGGFGRKSKWDFMLEAALLSQKLDGAPVLLQWTREDDIQHSFYHTTSVERIDVALDDKGKVTGWRHRTVAPSIVSTFKQDDGYQFPIEYGMGFVDVPFDVPNVRCENGQAMAHTRIGWFRSVSNVQRAFAVQSAVAEVAHKIGRDPKDFLLELIGPDRHIDPKASGFPDDFWNYGEPYEEFPINTARLKNVVRVAAEKAGWGKTLPAREGMGIAAHRSFASYVASVVHVKIDDDGTIRVPHVTSAIDCGFHVNPERIRSQMEGAAVMGMSNALYSGITFKNGAVQQSNYFDYNVTRMSNYPQKVDVHIIEAPWGVHAGGVGEPGVPPFAPALANAIFAASGKRLRNLPMGEKLA